MAILNSFAGSGGGVRIPLEPPTEFTVLRGNAENTLSWVDPVDKVANPGGEPVSTWAYDVLVRRSDRYPTSPSDGYPVFRNTVKNQGGAGVSYTDTGLTNGVPYYYALYSYTTIGVVSEGVTGTATPVGGIVNAGTLTALSGADQNLAGAAAGNYMIFGGGDKKTITAYDSSLTRTVPSSIVSENSAGEFAAASTGNHAIFSSAQWYGDLHGGDGSPSRQGYISVVSVYNSSLTRTEYVDGNLGYEGSNQVGCSAGGRAIFALGYDSWNSGSSQLSATVSDMIAINDSLTQSKSYLDVQDSDSRKSCGMVSLGNYCLIGPGPYKRSDRNIEDATNYIDVINSSLTYIRQYTHSVEIGNENTAVFASSPTHAILAGSGTHVTALDTSLTKTTPTGLPQSITNGAGVKIGEYALFANDKGAFAYDHALIQTTPEGLSVPRQLSCAVLFENRALFAGGRTPSGSQVDTVDVYTA